MTESEKSIDAVIAMVEADFPDLEWRVQRLRDTASQYYAGINRSTWHMSLSSGATPALALMNAYQAAMAEKETRSD